MKPEAIQCRMLSDDEQPAALPLLARCFPDYWENVAARNKRFPFRELSFAALDEQGEPVGHVGIMLYTVSDGHGGRLNMAGIASVAVDLACRGQGLATRLCLLAIEWAKKQGNIVSLPLYTGKFPVYAKSGWKIYETAMPQRATLPRQAASPLPLRPGCELTADEKDLIRRLYHDGHDFPGKVCRGNGTEYNDWPRIFAEPEYRFAVSPDAYAIICDQAVLEVYWRPALPLDSLADFLLTLASALDFTLDLDAPPDSAAWQALQKLNATIAECPRDLRHGERPMALDLVSPGPHDRPKYLYYPLTDKF